MLTLLKFSIHECSACECMAAFDSKVASGLGLEFVDVNLKNFEVYRRYRRILLQDRPLRSELFLPTYLLVDDPDGDFRILGEIVGFVPEERFERSIRQLMQVPAPATSGISDQERDG